MVFESPGFPKAVLCVAHQQRSDLLGVVQPGNFEVLLFLRTGTHLFVDGVLEFIRQNGFTLRPQRGLFHGDTLVGWTEHDIFISAGLAYERYILFPSKYKIAACF